MAHHGQLTRYETVCQPLVALLAIGLNIPPVVLGIIAAINWCPYYGQFLIPNAVLCLLNLGAVGYAVYKMRKKVRFDGLRYSHNNNEDDSTAEEEENENGVRRSERLQAQSGRAVSNGDATATSWATNPADEDGKKDSKDANIDTNGDVEQANGKMEEGPVTETSSSKVKPTTSSAQSPTQMQSSDSNADDSNDSRKPHHSCFKRCLKLRTTSSNRIRHLVCYNGLMTTYGILFLFWAFWLGSGAQMAVDADGASDKELEGCSEAALKEQYNYVHVSVVLGFVYFAFVIVCLVASFCDHH